MLEVSVEHGLQILLQNRKACIQRQRWLRRRLVENLLDRAFHLREPLAIEVNRHRLHIAFALASFADGNLSHVKAVGNGVLEYKIDFGPGYRIYFGRDGDRLIILLAGGTKKRQQEDIRQAKANWEDYRNRKT